MDLKLILNEAKITQNIMTDFLQNLRENFTLPSRLALKEDVHSVLSHLHTCTICVAQKNKQTSFSFSSNCAVFNSSSKTALGS